MSSDTITIEASPGRLFRVEEFYIVPPAVDGKPVAPPRSQGWIHRHKNYPCPPEWTAAGVTEAEWNEIVLTVEDWRIQ